MDLILKDVEECIGNLVRRESEIERISTVTRKTTPEWDFATGRYRSRPVWEPIAFTQVVTATTKGRENAVFVETAPKRGIQRNNREILGEEIIIFPSLQPNEENETLFDLIKSLNLDASLIGHAFLKVWKQLQ